MKNLKKDSTAGLLEMLPSFDPGFLDRAEFRGKFNQQQQHIVSFFIIIN